MEDNLPTSAPNLPTSAPNLTMSAPNLTRTVNNLRKLEWGWGPTGYVIPAREEVALGIVHQFGVGLSVPGVGRGWVAGGSPDLRGAPCRGRLELRNPQKMTPLSKMVA